MNLLYYFSKNGPCRGPCSLGGLVAGIARAARRQRVCLAVWTALECPSLDFFWGAHFFIQVDEANTVAHLQRPLEYLDRQILCPADLEK
jgi:hypothetical protein